MMDKPAAVTQPSFASGELTPSLYGRIDLATYYTALKTCRNFIVRPFGGVTNRPGTQFLTEVKDSTKKVRLIPFQYSADDTYVLEFGDLYIRVLKNGAYVLDGVDPLEIVTPWGEEVLYLLKYVQSGDVMTLTYNQTRPRQLSRFAEDDWTLTEFANSGGPFQEINIDTNITISSSGVVGNVVLTSNVGSFFTEDMVGRLLYIEQHPDIYVNAWEVQKAVGVNATVRAGGNYYQAVTAGTTGTLRPSVVDGTERDGFPGVTWNYLHSGSGIVRITSVLISASPKLVTNAVNNGAGLIRLTVNAHSLLDGSLVQVIGVSGVGAASGEWVISLVDENTIDLVGSTFSGSYISGGNVFERSAESANATVISRLPEGIVTGTIPKTITGVTSGVDPEVEPPTAGTPARIICPNHGFTSLSTVTIAGVLGATQVNGTWAITVIDQDTFELGGVYATSAYTSGGTATIAASGSASYKWAVEAWGGDQYYPQCSIYYQQRQIFGGRPTRPHQIQMSNSGGAFRDFSSSVPLLDNEAVTFELIANKLLEIRHFVVMRDLVALTSEGPWSIQKEIGVPVPVCTSQGRGGISHVHPLEVEGRALYVPRKGNSIRSIGYNWEQDGYDAKDMTIRAAHLFFGKQISEWAYQEIPFNCVWCVLSDGSLVAMTYVPEQEVIAWHRHDTDGLCESISCVSEGLEDSLYIVIKRTIDGEEKRYIERLGQRFFSDPRDAFFVDSGLSYDGRTLGASIVWSLATESGGWTYQDTLTLTTTTPFFVGSSDVGDMLVIDDGGEPLRLLITAYASATEVTVMASRDVPAAMQATPQAGFEVARNTFAGLDHLEGKSVAIIADGNAEPAQVVASGTIVLERPAVVVHIGLPITADLETLDLSAQGQTLQDKVKNVGSVILLVEETRGLEVGPGPDHLLQYKPQESGYYGSAVAADTGMIEMNILSDWSRGGRIFIRQSEPLPVTILAAIPQVVVGNV